MSNFEIKKVMKKLIFISLAWIAYNSYSQDAQAYYDYFYNNYAKYIGNRISTAKANHVVITELDFWKDLYCTAVSDLNTTVRDSCLSNINRILGTSYTISDITCPTGGAGGDGVWGLITGTLTDQTDLNSALGAKADSSSYMRKSVYDPAANGIVDESENVSDADYGDVTVSSGTWGVEDDSHNHLITNIDAFTESQLETQLSDVTAIFTNNVTGDVTLSGGTSTIGTGAVGSTELASTTVTQGSYTNTNLTVDADGRITLASSGSVALDSSSITYSVDTISGNSTNYVNFIDSLGLYYAIDAQGDVQWVYLSTNGYLGADSLVTASKQLYDELIPIEELLKNTKNGEIGWVAKDGSIEYHMKGTPSDVIYKLMGGIEHSYRYNYELTKRVEFLESQIDKMYMDLSEDKCIKKRFLRRK